MSKVLGVGIIGCGNISWAYLKLANLKLGLLINFGAPRLKDGLHRIVNDLPAADSPLLRVNHRPTPTG